MTLRINESDWKVLRELHGIALERFCQRVIEEVESTIDSRSNGDHDCYVKVFDLLRKRDKQLARTFDDLRRSNALFLLANIKHARLLTDDELMRFSSETREAVERIDSIFRH